jgi:hypothetical protein
MKEPGVGDGDLVRHFQLAAIAAIAASVGVATGAPLCWADPIYIRGEAQCEVRFYL